MSSGAEPHGPRNTHEDADTRPPARVRWASLGDVPALKAVYRRASLSNEGDLPLYVAHPELLDWPSDGAEEGRTRVAVADDRVIGFATLSYASHGAELEDMFVDPDWMRRGIGRTLVEDIAAVASHRGYGVIEVDANPHALAFYTEVGFTVVGEVAVAYGTGTRMRRTAP